MVVLLCVCVCVSVCVCTLVPMQQVMQDRWMNIGYEGHELTPYVEPLVDKNNELRILRMLEMGFSRKEIQESLSENSYDEVCATYYLLGKEVLHSREVSHLSTVVHSVKLLDMYVRNCKSFCDSCTDLNQFTFGGSTFQANVQW